MNDDFQCFRYRKIDKYLIESLVSPSLYFARPDTLNDPFDCQINLRRVFERALASASPQRTNLINRFLGHEDFFKRFETELDKRGVCSFSLVHDDPLMWSHYADGHKGICLAYRLPESFLWHGNFKLTVGGEVEYLSNPLSEWLDSVSVDISIEEFVGQLLLKYLRVKSLPWKYEQEARLIRDGQGVLPIPKGCRQQVCFGLATPQSDIDLVLRLARDYSGCGIFAKMVRSDREFGFEMQAYEQVG